MGLITLNKLQDNIRNMIIFLCNGNSFDKYPSFSFHYRCMMIFSFCLHFSGMKIYCQRKNVVFLGSKNTFSTARLVTGSSVIFSFFFLINLRDLLITHHVSCFYYFLTLSLNSCFLFCPKMLLRTQMAIELWIIALLCILPKSFVVWAYSLINPTITFL